jgi:hypothetical protein
MSQGIRRLLASLAAIMASLVLITTGLGAFPYAQGSGATGAQGPSGEASSTAPCWRGDYEPGHPWDRLDASAGSLTKVTSPVRQGAYAEQFSLRPEKTTTSVQRSEVIRTQHHVEGEDTWLAWSIFLPSAGFKIDSGGDVVVTEWVDNPPYFGSPEIQVTVLSLAGRNHLGMAVRGGAEDETTQREWILAVVQYDRWLDLKMHIHWASTDQGLVELWVDGKQAVTRRTPTIYEGKFVYLKQGLSRTASKLATSLYQDATVVSTQEGGLSCPSAADAGPSTMPGRSSG